MVRPHCARAADGGDAVTLSFDTSFTSDNHSERGSFAIQLILLHATVGSLRSSLDWLCNPASEVSTHYVIAQDGKIYRLVVEEKCAWHAGKAIWHGQTKVNELSIGIELVNMTGVKGFKGQDPYPKAQIDALSALTLDIFHRRALSLANVARHLDVATPPGRKTDPVGFPYDAWRNALMTTPTPPPTVPTMPMPVVQTYTVKGMPLVGVVVYQAQSLTGAVAGFLPQGSTVEIDMLYDGDVGHVKGGLGFVSLKGLQVGPL